MDLKEFVTETLISVNDGIKDAITRLDAAEGVGTINPHWRGHDANWKDNVETVEFDIAVTISETKSGGGKASINVLPIQIGGEGSKSIERGTISKVKFSIPVIFPASARDAEPPKSVSRPKTEP